MPRFIVDDLSGDKIEICGGDASHIALSLRMKQGERLTLCDGKAMEAECEIVSVCRESVEVSVLERRISAAEPKTEVVLYQALPKFDKLEYIVQKSVELGVSEIIPVLTSRCISRPDDKTMEKKRERLQKIADEAAKQSGRGRLPKVGELLGFKEAAAEMSTAALPILFFEHGTEPLSTHMQKYSGGKIAVMIGSEGGFSDEEAKFCSEKGILTATLGPRILRCETAPVAAISAIMYSAGEMEIK